MSHENVLEAIDVCKKFGAFEAVRNISFGLKPGEILGLLGPNGAGKTTTIQILLGILTMTSGTVRYFGKDFQTHREDILERVNFSSTYTNLPWRLKVKEALHYTSYLYDIKNRTEKLNTITSMFRLEEILNKEISDLSAGQNTRLNLAKAFINDPDVLLLDEPTASLDPETADHVRRLIQKERKKRNVSILFTSHNMQEIETMCDRVIIINHGRIVAEDKPENLPKKIKRTRVELTMIDGLKRTAELCKELKLIHVIDERLITIDIDETRIAEFLNTLASKGITYDQISIDKPTLEDFFLEIAREKQ